MARSYGIVKSFKAYLAIAEQFPVAKASTLRSELQALGVSLIDCPHNRRKEVADKMIIGEQLLFLRSPFLQRRGLLGVKSVDMLAYAIDNPAPATIILITGDRDFAYAMSILRMRQYQVILVTLPNAHFSLTAPASIYVLYSDMLSKVEQPPGRTSNHQVFGDGRAPSQDMVSHPTMEKVRPTSVCVASAHHPCSLSRPSTASSSTQPPPASSI